MHHDGFQHDTLLKSGEMAEINEVSRKALLVYQSKRLVEPSFVDDETGWRYFSIVQSAEVDLVKLLKSAGLTLDEIKEVKETADVEFLKERLNRSSSVIRERIDELRGALYLSEALARECDAFINMPETNVPRIEDLPERYAVRFEPPKKKLALRKGKTLSMNELWEAINRQTNEVLDRAGLPRLALKGRGFIAPLSQMKNTAAWADERLLYIEGEFAETTDAAITLEKGPHAVTYFTECGLGSVEDSAESYLRCVEDMLALAEREGYEPKSGPICEEICRFPHLLDPAISSAYRLCLPVFPKTVD